MDPTPLVDILGIDCKDESHELPVHSFAYPPASPAQHIEDDAHDTVVKPGELPFG